jgi:hypothetical protein
MECKPLRSIPYEATTGTFALFSFLFFVRYSNKSEFTKIFFRFSNDNSI